MYCERPQDRTIMVLLLALLRHIVYILPSSPNSGVRLGDVLMLWLIFAPAPEATTYTNIQIQSPLEIWSYPFKVKQIRRQICQIRWHHGNIIYRCYSIYILLSSLSFSFSLFLVNFQAEANWYILYKLSWCWPVNVGQLISTIFIMSEYPITSLHNSHIID